MRLNTQAYTTDDVGDDHAGSCRHERRIDLGLSSKDSFSLGRVDTAS